MNRRLGRYKYFFIAFLICSFQYFALSQSNPFEITNGSIPKANPAIKTDIQAIKNDSNRIAKDNLSANKNPFDIVKNTPTNEQEDSLEVANKSIEDKIETIPSPSTIGKQSGMDTIYDSKGNRSFYFVTILMLLLLLTVLVSLNRSLLSRINQSLLNDNMMKYLHRNQLNNYQFSYLLFYLYFIFNLGLFTYFIINYKSSGLGLSNASLFALCTLAILLTYFVKHFFLLLTSHIFPVEKEGRLFSFTVQNFNIILGLYLTPINILLAFGPIEFIEKLIWIGIGLIILFYAIRQIRGIGFSSRFLAGNSFQLFLYICAAEIAPLLIIGKSILAYLN